MEMLFYFRKAAFSSSTIRKCSGNQKVSNVLLGSNSYLNINIDSLICDRLSTEGMDLNHRHPLGWTALHVASINGRAGAVSALLEAGADPDLGDEFINVQRTSIEKGLHSMDGETNNIVFSIF